MHLTRREILRAGLAAALGSSLPLARAAESPPRRPNLLFVFPDQWRRQGFGFMGQDPVHTPHLDRFAAESRVFTNAISNCPVCSPFRGMLMTGRYPYRTGIINNIEAIGEEGALRDDARTFPDVLHDEGYATGYIGKWHLSFGKPDPVPGNPHPWRGGQRLWRNYIAPQRRHGFDFWCAYPGGNTHFSPNYWTNEGGRERYEAVERWSPEHEADTAIRFIQNDGGQMRATDRPWALFVAMNPPHSPYLEVPDRYLDRYRDRPAETLLNRPNVYDGDEKANRNAREFVRGYFACMTGVDEQFGRILQTLDEAGQARDTVVVFTSDHGDMMGSHGRMQKNIWYEEALGIPLFVRCPDRLKSGTDDLLLSVPDYMPTLFGIMGLRAAIPPGIDGRDLSPTLASSGGGARPQSQLYLSTSGENRESRGVRTARHTFAIEWRRGQPTPYLFDNRADPHQLRNLAGDEAELAGQLQQQLAALLEETGDPARDRLAG